MTVPETIRRIGYACKTTFPDNPTETARYNFKSTTLSHLQKLDIESRDRKLESIIIHNLSALYNVMCRMYHMFPEKRMFRIGSDFLPMWDHPIAAPIYTRMRGSIERSLRIIGDKAREVDVRLSFHPDQFVVIASPNPDVATRGIATLEKVAEIANLMGYNGWHDHGFAINIHAGAASVTTEDLRDTINNRLSEDAYNFLTLENDEFSHNLEDLCELSDTVAIVPDLHHHWISQGHPLPYESSFVSTVIQSWRGVRPKLHLAMSRQHLIPPEYLYEPLPLALLIVNSGLTLTKSKLRAHSDSPWHTPTLNYARQFADRFDIMWEGKDKNLGQQIIYNHFYNNDRS
jgi:UV DNA damage repair endonuclease